MNRIQKIILRAISFSVLLITLLIFAGCLAITPLEREKLYNCYSDDTNYVKVSGVITRCHFYEDGGAWWSVVFNDDCVASLGQDIKLWGGFDSNGQIGGGFDIVSKNQGILNENNFYDLFTELISDPFTDSLFEHTVKIITVPKIWWNGWAYPIVQVKVDDEIYLEFETGKANLLDWIQYDLK